MLLTNDHVHPAIAAAAKAEPEAWMEALLAGYVTSADTGDEALVIASRAALAEYCNASPANLDRVCQALVRNLRTRQGQGQDRTTVPTLEIVAYLFYVGVFPRCRKVDYVKLCLLVQKAGYKTGNVRKLEACVKVYSAVACMAPTAGQAASAATDANNADSEINRADAVKEARKRLGALMHHPWPRIRSLVADELWGVLGVCSGGAGEEKVTAEKLLGVDWARADKTRIRRLVDEELCLT